ncbi:hypothetical protein SAMN06265182_1299 [Persephonella hydrogeniphila]|uniref:Uncharacterized protein n=1 Tax=Persephonella hydrogeniphila TaxID=198703 RepID=A0A285NG90_9AQUI|nr:hypothetical protein SAMN06265182_1299 [Persephonella hydrogeniphila]
MDFVYIAVVFIIMASMTALYFFVGYRFLKKHRGKKNGNN